MNKRWLVLLLFLMVTSDLWAISINRYLSGSWNNVNQSGHGFSIEVISDEVSVIYWFVYHPDGTPTFILAVGKNIGNMIVADAYYNSGMRFGVFDPAEREEIPWGQIKITFHSCSSATLDYSSELSYEGMPYGSGSIPLTRLLSIDGMQCSSNPIAGLYQGIIHSDEGDEDLIGFGIIAPNGELSVVGFGGIVGTGTIVVGGNNFSVGGTAVNAAAGETFETVLSMSGNIVAGYRMVGGYTAEEQDEGYFDLWSIPGLYRRAVSLAELAGSYDITNIVSGVNGSVDISETGEFFGSDSSGCEYDGALTRQEDQFNLFEVTIVLTKCGTRNGTYKGYGAQIDYYSLGDGRILRLITRNGAYPGLFDIYH